MRMLLNGTWECTLSDGRVTDVEVPGCWEQKVLEKDIADRVRYRKKFYLEELTDDACRLCFGSVSYYCEVWLNGVSLGAHEGMWDSFWMDTKGALKMGENELLLDIWKPGYQSQDRFPLRQVLSGFIPDVWCTFGGIWDNVLLESSPSYFVDRHFANGDCSGNVTVKGRLSGVRLGDCIQIEGRILDSTGKCAAKVRDVALTDGRFTLSCQVENPVLWEVEAPYLYQYTLSLSDGVKEEILSGTLGFRDFSCQKGQLTLNQKPVYPRGILHWGYYEEMIPNPPKDIIREEIQKVRTFGFNMMKHCLYIPREDYFQMADELGMLLWVELPLWLPEKTPLLEERIRREFPRLLEQISGHPSVVMLSLGCELDNKVDSQVLEDMYRMAREKLNIPVRDNSGSGECYEGLSVDYADFSDYHFYGELQNMENLMEVFTPSYRGGRPFVYGEFCDSDTLRDLAVLRREKGVISFPWEVSDPSQNPICLLKPDFFLGEHDDRMEKSGIRKEFQMLKELSLNHSLVHRKTTLEQTRSFQEVGGFNVTSIRDVPIATSGIFDDFMRPKFQPSVFTRFNSDVMLMPAWDLARVWLNADRVMSRERYGFFGGENYGLHVLVSNYGGHVLEKGGLTYRLLRMDGELVLEGTAETAEVENGSVGRACYLNFMLPQVEVPENLLLHVTLSCRQLRVENEWPVFLYPKPEPLMETLGIYDPLNLFQTAEKWYHLAETDGRHGLAEYRVVLCSVLTPEIWEYARSGGCVFYMQRGKGTLPAKSVAFWREGMIRAYEHPILSGISYEHWMDDLRYFGCAADSAFLRQQGELLEDSRPILRRYDCREWRADDYMLELDCEKGKMIATTLRLEGGMGKQPMFLENNRLGRVLLDRSVRYLMNN